MNFKSCLIFLEQSFDCTSKHFLDRRYLASLDCLSLRSPSLQDCWILDSFLFAKLLEIAIFAADLRFSYCRMFDFATRADLCLQFE